MTSYIICAFVSGFLLATVIFWIVTKQLQADWQAEYRRLMGGIKKAWLDIDNNDNKRPYCLTRSMIADNLRGIYYNVR